jgi:predicted nucleotidyltransferase
VGYYGYARATADLDIWVAIAPDNADKIVATLKEFGFDTENLTTTLFLQADKIVRLGAPPIRIELLTTISGVNFSDCYRARNQVRLDGIEVNLISLEHLKVNKRAAGRNKDLNDLENLP